MNDEQFWKLHKQRIVKGIMPLVYLIIFLFALSIFSLINKKFEDIVPINISVDATKHDIYSLENNDEDFVILQDQTFSLGALKTKEYYNLMIDYGNGKEQVSYEVKDVSIKDELEAGEQAYAAVTTTKKDDKISNTQVTLYVPKAFKIVKE